MPTPPLSGETAQDAVARVEQKLREGFRPAGMMGANGPGAIDAAAEDAITDGIVFSREGFRGRVRKAKDRFSIEPDWSLYRPARYQQPMARQVIERGRLTWTRSSEGLAADSGGHCLGGAGRMGVLAVAALCAVSFALGAASLAAVEFLVGWALMKWIAG